MFSNLTVNNNVENIEIKISNMKDRILHLF